MMGQIEDASLFLETCILNLEIMSMSPANMKPAQKQKLLEMECLMRTQLCALLSQLDQHKEAFYHCQIAVRIAHFLINELSDYNTSMSFRDQFNTRTTNRPVSRLSVEKTPNKLQKINKPKPSLKPVRTDDDIEGDTEMLSIFQISYKKVHPLLKKLKTFMVQKPEEQPPIDPDYQDDRQKIDELADELDSEGTPVDCENLLGFLNQKNIYTTLNISKYMKLERMDIERAYSTPDQDLNLTRSVLLKKIVHLVLAYFCMGTELRFLATENEEGAEQKESALWHGRAVEIAVAFFPSDCSLVKHLIGAYAKHHAPSTEVIKEDEESEGILKVLKAMKGVHSSKSAPIIQDLDYLYGDILN